MENIQANMCFDVVFLYENIGTCLFTPAFPYFLRLVLTFTRPLHHNGKGSIRDSFSSCGSTSVCAYHCVSTV